MKIAADGVPVLRAFGPIRTVIAASDLDSAHGRLARSEVRQAAVVLETDDVTPLALDHDIADESLRPGDGGQVEQSDARQRVGRVGSILVTKECRRYQKPAHELLREQHGRAP